MRRSLTLRSVERAAHYPVWKKPSRAPHAPMVPARPVLPLLPHPDHQAPPPRPQSLPLPPPPPGYTRTLHASPAAYPRTLRGATGDLSRSSHPFRKQPDASLTGESKDQRKARLNGEAEACVRLRHGAEYWTLDEAQASGEPGLWVAVERWRRDKPAGAEHGGVTLVMRNACGMAADHWQPMLHNLMAGEPARVQFGTGAPLKDTKPVVIDDIWFLDDPHHHSSVDLNAGRLGAVHSWTDTGREVINFVEHVLPAVLEAEQADKADKDAQVPETPWGLSWAPSRPTRPAPVIGVGHSYGGNGVVQAAHARPDLFAGIFLVEPMCIFVNTNTLQLGWPLTNAALRRRDTWPSRAAAAAANRSNPMFGRWNPAVFDLWVSHSLVPVDPAEPEGAVTLATPTWAEAATFSDPNALPRGWDKLADLDMPVGFLQAGEADMWTAGEQTVNEMVFRTPGARNERIMEASHLVVQERPAELAEAFARFLATLKAGWFNKD